MLCATQLRVLLRKQVLQKVRSPVEALVEFFVPLAFIGIMAALFFAFNTSFSPDASFINATVPTLPFGVLPFRLAYTSNVLAVVCGPSGTVSADGLNASLKCGDFLRRMADLHPPLDLSVAASANSNLSALLAPMNASSPTGIPRIPGFLDTVKLFQTNAELEAYITTATYDTAWEGNAALNKKVWGAIVFTSADLTSYAIRLNESQAQSTDGAPVDVLRRSANDEVLTSYATSKLDTDGPPFLREKGDAITRQPAPGFLTVQREVDRVLIQIAAGAPLALPRNPALAHARASVVLSLLMTAMPLNMSFQAQLRNATQPILLNASTGAAAALDDATSAWLASEALPPQDVTLVPFPLAAYTTNPFYSLVLTVLSLLLVIAYVIPNSRLIRGIVSEKESKMREGMRMMGLSDASLFGAHLLWYAVVYHLPLSLLVAAITGASFFPKAGFGNVFILFWLFGLASTALMFCLSSFFSLAKSATSFGALIFIAAFFPTFAITPLTPIGAQRLAALLPPTAFGLGLSVMGAFENNGVPLSPSAVLNNWSFASSIGMLVLDTFLFIALGAYIDAVLPASWRGFGVPRPWYFFLTPSFWREVAGCAPAPGAVVARGGGGGGLPCCRKPRQASVLGEVAQAASADASYFEEPDANLRALRANNRCVAVAGLRKVFDTPDGPKVAVENASFDMYEGQIFVLLGPNGAGKTTTISMLTGLIEPSGGATSFFGAAHGAASARRSLGVCPQHDVLWPDLTVREHLEIFAAIKGTPAASVAGEVDKIIREVGLTEKVGVFSKALSGGMKRKLSVAIALIGGSAVVVLDEPTSGMDPFSRRSTWSILQNARAGRVILLTTHFMDEADILGDRVAIMGTGTVKCTGTPMFLKKRYGVGYLLTLVKAPSARPAAALELLRAHVPAASTASNVAGELRVRLPLTASQGFSAMLTALDEALPALGFVNYGISVTSIEDVFLKIAEGTAAGAGAGVGGLAQTHSPGGKTVEIEMPTAVRKLSGDAAATGATALLPPLQAVNLDAVRSRARAEQGGALVFLRQLHALFLKRVQYARRDWRAITYQLLLPGVLIALGLGLIKLGGRFTHIDLALSTAQFNGGASPVVAPAFLFKPAGGFAPTSQNITALLDATNLAADAPLRKNQIEANGIPDYPGGGLLISGGGPLAYAGLPSPSREHQQMSVFLLGDRASRAVSTFGAFVVGRSTFFPNDDPSTLPPISAGASASIFVNTTALHSPAVWLNTLDTALLRLVSGGSSSPPTISASTWPLPSTSRQRTLFNGLLVFAASLIIIIAFAYVASNTALFIVKEREVAAKHQQIISGVSVAAYWVANFLFDYVAFLLPAVLAIVLCAAFGIQEFVSSESHRVNALLLNFFLFGLASTTSTYIICFLFKSPASAQSAVLFLNVFSIILIAASQFLSQIQSTCVAERSIRYVFALLPSYPFGFNLVTLSFLSLLPVITATCNGGTPENEPAIDALDWKGCGAMLLYMAMQFLVYSAVILGIEYVNAKPALRQLLMADPMKVEAPIEEDEDVAREAARVAAQRAGGPDAHRDAILISNLRKVYPGGKTAVRELSFGVAPGEVFGFLGINGAGKTTTLQMLSGDVLPSSGTALMAGYDILTAQPSVRRLLGYCPQFDSLLELLTVREHLELFARIKGVPEAELGAVVRQKVAELDLGAFTNKTAGSLSGGNKRKLCVAIALIGDPPLVFLDEPSTGMDPVAKRFM